jgi:Curli production assembly/transport component CsgG
MKSYFILFICLLSSLIGYSQAESKPVIGVAEFTKEVDSKYAGAVAEKVVQIVTNTRRFTVVDRTSYDKVKKELEFQKSEAFIDSKNTVKQDVALAAQFMIVGHILKMSVYAMKNSDGSVNGYKASVAFTIKVNDVETGKTTESESFQTNVSPLMLSAESAVNEALKTVESNLASYFLKTFPLSTKVIKILITKKEAASTVLIAGGKSFGFNEGDKLIVERIELLEGKPYPSQIGEIKIVKMAGDDFSECLVSDGGKEILLRFNAAEKLTCKLIVD